MEDYRIVDLYWARNETAITESDRKYGGMLKSLSYSLLSSREDAEECVNDTYLDAWNAMPTARPEFLGAFLSKITRRISIDRWRREHREKRGGIAAVEELNDCIPSESTVEGEYQNGVLAEAIYAFLASLPKEKRVIFLRRYFFSQPLSTIARELGMSEGKVKTVLFRLRERLRERLEAEKLL